MPSTRRDREDAGAGPDADERGDLVMAHRAAQIIRVHDVAPTRDAVLLFEALKRVYV